MPDIAMCNGTNCPLKETCYRFKAKPCEYQTYFMTPPLEDGKCEYYWKMEEKPNLPGGHPDIKEI